MKRKILAMMMCLMMLIGLLPTTVFAAAIPTFDGAGTKEDPWLISSSDDLVTLSEFVNAGEAVSYDFNGAGIGNYYGYYFKQTCDIDMTGVAWEPIGYSGDDNKYFAGNYDGDGHSIINAVSSGKVDSEGFSTVGIFGWASFGSIENLHVKNANFTATGQDNYSFAGGIAGVCYGATIRNCSVMGSSVESRRNSNNNSAGSIVGYSTGGKFEKCAAENNKIKSMAYAGGFVGETDDGYDVGNSSFTDCYVYNCDVNSSTEDASGLSIAGGFAGQMTDSTLTINNCYVYNTIASTEGTTTGGEISTGVFAGSLWGGCVIDDANCFFGKCEMTEKTGSALEKTEAEFADGTVAGLLGDAFAQSGDHPVFNGPADYTKVDEAIAKANALNRDEYKDFTAVEAAIGAVVRDKKLSEQAEVDAMAQAIEDAITALEYKKADYTKVDEAIAKAKALNRDEYKDFTAVDNAVKAVVRGKNITEQAEVDAMAKAIEDAIAALEYKEADYSKVDEAIAKANALNRDEYKDFTAVDNAVKAVVRGKNITEQAEVDAMAKAIEDAMTVLEKKAADHGKTDETTGKKDESTGKVNDLKKPVKNKPSTVSSPKTGDTANIALWITLLVVGSGAAVGTTIVKRRKK